MAQTLAWLRNGSVYTSIDLCTCDKDDVLHHICSLRCLVDLDRLQRVRLSHFEQLRRVRNRQHLRIREPRNKSLLGQV